MSEEDKQLQEQGIDKQLDCASSDLKKLGALLRKTKGRERKRLHDLFDEASTVFSRIHDIEDRWVNARSKELEHLSRGWLELDAKLREACTQRSWRLDGSWPQFFVEYGIHLEFDERTKSARAGRAKVSDCDLDSLVAVLSPQVETLLPKKFSPTEFLERLAEAYDDARGGTAQVLVFDIYKTLVIRLQGPGFWRNAQRDKFSGLTIEQFRARLCKTIEANALRTKGGRELRVFPPLDAKDGLFVFNPAEHRQSFIGRVEFLLVRGA